MIVVNRFRIPEVETATFLAKGRAAVEVLGRREGFLTADLGRNLDDASLWTITTRWRNVGSYRRALQGAASLKEKVKRLLNPLHGGPKGEGWPFGRAVGKADLYPVVEGVEGVDRITDLVIIDESRRLRVEMLKLSEDELPQLIGVEIYDRG